MRRVNGSVLVLVVCGLVAAGCGSSSKSDAISTCKKAANSIPDASARKIAQDACSSANTNAAGVSNAVSTAVSSAQSAAKQACLAGAQNAPAGTPRDQAVAGCNKIK